MIRTCFLAIILAIGCAASAQVKTIKPEEVDAHIGDSVRICAKVMSSRYYVQLEGKPTVFYFGNLYPKHSFSVIIWQKDRKNFKQPVELAYGDGDLCMKGKLVLVDGKPQLEVSSPDQIGYNDEGD
jgi:hypothetical protein